MSYVSIPESSTFASCTLAVSLFFALPGCSAAPATPDPSTEPPSDADVLAKACSEDSEAWKRKLEGYCGALERSPRPSYLNLPRDPAARGEIPSDVPTLELSSEGVRDGEWSLDPARVSTRLDALAAQAGDTSRYALAADAMTPTSLVVDVMRMMHERGMTRVDLVAVTESSNDDTFSPGSRSSLAALQEVVSVEDRKAQTLERVAQASGDDCQPMVSLYQALSVVAPERRCDAMAGALPPVFEECSCDVDIDFVAASLMLPFEETVRRDTLGAHTFTIAPDGASIGLDMEDTWNTSFFVFVSSSTSTISPVW